MFKAEVKNELLENIEYKYRDEIQAIFLKIRLAVKRCHTSIEIQYNLMNPSIHAYFTSLGYDIKCHQPLDMRVDPSYMLYLI